MKLMIFWTNTFLLLSWDIFLRTLELIEDVFSFIAQLQTCQSVSSSWTKLSVLVLFLFILKKKLQSKVFSAGIASQRPTVYKIRSLTIWIPNCWGLLTLTLTNCEEGIPPSNIPLPLYQQCNFCHPFIWIFFVLYCLHISSLSVFFILS